MRLHILSVVLILLRSLFRLCEEQPVSAMKTMTRQFWYVRDFIGQRAQVKLVDFSSRGWGHINFDDLEGDITCSNLENTGIYLA